MPLRIQARYERLRMRRLRMRPDIDLGLFRDGVLLDFFECLLNIMQAYGEL
jgi:hypothetical protein